MGQTRAVAHGPPLYFLKKDVMIYFVCTFPPIICGIGDYIKCLVSKLPEDSWRVISPETGTFAISDEPCDHHVSYTISLSNPHLPPDLDGDILWFQHAFGMWGDPSIPFIKLIKEAKQKKNKIVATLQALHFQSTETPFGFDEREYRLLKEVIPYLDALPVFSDGTCRAVIKAFPEHKDKITVLRHGVQTYPAMVPQESAKKIFLKYLMDQADIPRKQKEEITALYDMFFSEKTVLIGNFGFITQDRDPLSVYRLRESLDKKLPDHKVIAIYIGTVQKRVDKSPAEMLPLLNRLKSIHDGRYNLFFENYLPNEILPFAFRALDYTVIWYQKATQSGRMAFAQGTGSCTVGRDIEGVGETLNLSGLPAAVTMDELSEKIKRLVLKPDLREKVERASNDYVNQFSFGSQARKHLLIEQSIRSQEKMPFLDRTV